MDQISEIIKEISGYVDEYVIESINASGCDTYIFTITIKDWHHREIISPRYCSGDLKESIIIRLQHLLDQLKNGELPD